MFVYNLLIRRLLPGLNGDNTLAYFAWLVYHHAATEAETAALERRGRLNIFQDLVQILEG
jgi:hypothetical protein